jgi:hypothetical protein
VKKTKSETAPLLRALFLRRKQLNPSLKYTVFFDFPLTCAGLTVIIAMYVRDVISLY